MYHHSRKIDGSCILDDSKRSCQGKFWGKILSFFFFFLFFLLFPSSVFAGLPARTSCYVGSTLDGTFEIVNYPAFYSNWLISGSSSALSFSSTKVQNDEISFKLGTSDWVVGTEIGSFYYTNLAVGNERCGYVWGNVRWRSTTDGQVHYCNLKVPKYDTGSLIQNFITLSCIGSNCRNTSNPLARAVFSQGGVNFEKNTGETCSDYNLYLNGNPRGFYGTGPADSDTCSWDSDFQLTSTDGLIEAYVSPQPPNGFTSAQANAQTYNYINETSCGTPITPTPTIIPTPVPKNICDKVTGYVRDSITKKGIKGAKVTAHGIDNSVGNCLGKHYSCGTVTTNANGYFEVSCTNVSDSNMKCLGVYETNKVGFTDAYGAYGPTGSSVWNNNTIMYSNPQVNSCGLFNFWDKK